MDTTNSNTPAPVETPAKATRAPSAFTAAKAALRKGNSETAAAVRLISAALAAVCTAQGNRKATDGTANAVLRAVNAEECAGIFADGDKAKLHAAATAARAGVIPSREVRGILRTADANARKRGAEEFTANAGRVETEADAKSAAAAAKAERTGKRAAIRAKLEKGETLSADEIAVLFPARKVA